MKRAVLGLAVAAVVGFGVFWFLTTPDTLADRDAAVFDTGDATNGEVVFHAGGCASCHAAPGADGDAKRLLAGGIGLDTPFGTFHAPNISTDAEHGLGAWSGADFALAMLKGVSPQDTHYYPAFPYTQYARMTDGDVADLWAYMKTLPASEAPSKAHDLSFPFTLRRGLGLWKAMHLDPAPATPPSADPVIERGRYLVEGPGHCAACHTPRDMTGGLYLARWMAGAPNPSGKGRIPAIDAAGLTDWSASDIAYALESGFTPEFDSLGGSMADVVDNMAQLPAADREAIAAYLKSLP